MKRLVIVIGVSMLAGCGGGGSSAPFVGAPAPGTSATPTPSVTATPTPGATATPTPGATATPTPGATATPAPTALAVSPSSLQFTATGYALSFGATEAGYTGALTAT